MYGASAERPPVPDLGVGDVRHHLRQQRRALGHQLASLHNPLPGHGSDPHSAGDRSASSSLLPSLAAVPNLVPGGSNEGQLLDPVQVDEDGGPGEPEVHGRDEALTPGQSFRIPTVLP